MDDVVRELFEAWQAREAALDEHRRQLRAAVVAYVDAQGPDPAPLLDQLKETRGQCNSLCSGLLWAIRDSRARGA
jgi:hypothetical protein